MTTSIGSRTYSVLGMTCDHCASSVREEVADIEGVRAVDVDLKSGQLIVSGDGFADEAVEAAVQDAGYQLVA